MATPNLRKLSCTELAAHLGDADCPVQAKLERVFHWQLATDYWRLFYFTTLNSFVTWNTPGIPFTASVARFLSPSLFTNPASVIRWFFTMM